MTLIFTFVMQIYPKNTIEIFETRIYNSLWVVTEKGLISVARVTVLTFRTSTKIIYERHLLLRVYSLFYKQEP